MGSCFVEYQTNEGVKLYRKCGVASEGGGGGGRSAKWEFLHLATDLIGYGRGIERMTIRALAPGQSESCPAKFAWGEKT